MGKLLKGPLAVTIPLLAVAMVAVIGISIGLIFIAVTKEFNADATLIVAVAFTAIVMAIAGFLSYRDYQNPSSGEATAAPAGRSGGDAPANARNAATTKPARGRRKSR